MLIVIKSGRVAFCALVITAPPPHASYAAEM
jgi:hypothetical protein